MNKSIFVKITELLGTRESIIIHSIIITSNFALIFLGVDLDTVLLIVTTVLTIEAIYLSLFLQLSINEQNKNISEIRTDTEEIVDDVNAIKIETDEIVEDSRELVADINEIAAESDEIIKDTEELVTDVNNLSEANLVDINKKLNLILVELEKLKKTN